MAMAQISRSLGMLDRALSQHAVVLSLVLAYLSLFFRSGEVLPLTSPSSGLPAPAEVLGSDLLLPDEVTLSREALLARSRQGATQKGEEGKMKKAPTMRKAFCEECHSEDEEAKRQEELTLPPAKRLSKALEVSLKQVAAMPGDPAHRDRLMADVYTSLGHSYSAQGQYHQALHSMSLAGDAAGRLYADPDALVQSHTLFGHLEYKHHRYYAAWTRFEDALKGPWPHERGGGGDRLLPAIAGAAWASIMQGNFAEARMQLMKDLSAATGDEETFDSCNWHGDGFDVDRALALLSLNVMSQALTGSGDPDHPFLVECASTLLHAGGGAGSMRDRQVSAHGPRAAMAWDALCIARHAAGDAERARRCVAEASAIRPEDPVAASHSLLQETLIDFSAGKVEPGQRRIEGWLASCLASGMPKEEIIEWLHGFGQAHAWLPGGSELVNYLQGVIADGRLSQ